MTDHDYSSFVLQAWQEDFMHYGRCSCGQWQGKGTNPNLVWDGFLEHRSRARAKFGHPSAKLAGLTPEEADEIRYSRDNEGLGSP